MIIITCVYLFFICYYIIDRWGHKEINPVIEEQETKDSPLVKRIIERLRNEPENFSAIWFTGKVLEKSVLYRNKELLIHNDGDILHPFRMEMTKSERAEIVELLQPIIERDKQELIKILLK